jgi:formate hydrogenlyase subunit 3/multisubunit Na+/H+ antiporter MnhD subunit
MFVLGGCTLMLYGLIDLSARAGSLDFAALATGLSQNGPALFDGICILIGFAVMSGLYPLHIWLPGAYAEANASVLPLFGLLGASGTVGMLLLCGGLFAGDTVFTLVLFCMGAASVLLGSVFSLLTPDLMRALAFVAIAQTGALTVSIAAACGIPQAGLSAQGAALHAVTLSLGMGTLLLSAGVFLRERGDGGLNALRGAGRGNILLTAFFALGALSLSCVPLSGGYLSSAMMLKGAVDGATGAAGTAALIAKAARWLIVGAGAFTFAAMTKLFLWLFVDPPHDEAKPHVCCGRRAVLALALIALPLLAVGFAPQTLAMRIAALAGESLGAGETGMEFYTSGLLRNAMLTAVIGSALYVAIGWWALTNRQGYFHTMRSGFSLEKYAYRPMLKALVFIGTLLLRFLYSIPEWFIALCEYVLNFGTQPRTEPGRDDHFALYSKKYVRVNPIRQMLAYELLLFGLGVVIALLYLLMG